MPDLDATIASLLKIADDIPRLIANAEQNGAKIPECNYLALLAVSRGVTYNAAATMAVADALYKLGDAVKQLTGDDNDRC